MQHACKKVHLEFPLRHFLQQIPTLDFEKRKAGKTDSINRSIGNTEKNDPAMKNSKLLNKTDEPELEPDEKLHTSKLDKFNQILMWGKETDANIHILRRIIRMLFEMIIILSVLSIFKYCFGNFGSE